MVSGDMMKWLVILIIAIIIIVVLFGFKSSVGGLQL